MADIDAARRAIDEHVLGVMFAGYIPDFGVCETYFHLRTFVTPGITREIARGVLRDLTDKGLCHYRSGLFTEDGEVAGAGYGLTREGIATYLELTGRERSKGMGDVWKEQQDEVTA